MKSPFIDDAIKNDRQVKDAEVLCDCKAEILWYRLPGGEWKANEIQKQVDNAVSWFVKYCIHLTFREFAIDPVKNKEVNDKLKKWVDRYTATMQNVNRAKATPEATMNAIQECVEHIYGALMEKEEADRKEEKKKQKTPPKPEDDKPTQLLTVMFLDEWYINTSELGGQRVFRVSANDPAHWLIAMLRYDRDSLNMLTHELTHALRKAYSLKGRNAKCLKEFVKTNRVVNAALTAWGDHYAGQNQDKAMTRPTRHNPFVKENLAASRVFSVNEYLTVIDAGYVGCKEGCSEVKGSRRPRRRIDERHKRAPESAPGGEKDPRKERPFRFAGVRLRHANLLDWCGKLPVEGLAGFQLYRMDDFPEGRKAVLLHKGLLPLDGNFYDLTQRSIPAPDPESLWTLTEAVVSEQGPRLSVNLQEWLDLAAGIDGLPLAPCCRGEPVQNVPLDGYLLVGVYEGGERDGAYTPVDQRCTDDELAKLRKRVQKALEQIKDRGLVDKLFPNPDYVDYDSLLRFVEIEYVCGGIPVQARTEGNGQAVAGTNKMKSRITINGGACKDMDDESLIAVLLHELSHALRNLNGTTATAGQTNDLVTIVIDAVAREIAAFWDVWERINDESIHLTENEKCAEIVDAVSEIMEKFDGLSKALEGSGGTLTAAQRRAVSNMRNEGRVLLQRYRDYLRSLPPEQICKTAAGKSVLDRIDELLSDVFGVQ